jgi:hypothetical protein
MFHQQIDERIAEFLDEFAAPHGFNGHTHVPALLTRQRNHRLFDPHKGIHRDPVHTFVGPSTLFFVPREPCTIDGLSSVEMAVNVGSVGQPRRLGDHRASYVVYDGDSVAFRRVEYPWRTTAAKLAALPIPERERAQLVERLGTGV